MQDDEDISFIALFAEKNEQSQILSCNKNFLFYSGTRIEDNILGHTDYDLPWQEYAAEYRAHELDALSGKCYSCIIPLIDKNGDTKICMHTKVRAPGLGQNQYKLLCRCDEIINRPIVDLFSKLLNERYYPLKKISINKQVDEFNLTPREQETLFYLLRGNSSKQIAKLMALSARTIETYLDKLKGKFSCFSKDQLIDCAISLGYMEILPLTCLKKLLRF